MPMDGKGVLLGLFLPGEVIPVVVASGRDIKTALNRVLEVNWRRLQNLVFKRAGWRCERCNQIRPLQCNHKTYRSHGRRDVPDNLEALCPECHHKEHGGR